MGLLGADALQALYAPGEVADELGRELGGAKNAPLGENLDMGRIWGGSEMGESRDMCVDYEAAVVCNGKRRGMPRRDSAGAWWSGGAATLLHSVRGMPRSRRDLMLTSMAR